MPQSNLAWWQLNQAVTPSSQGLTTAQAQAMQALHGPNVLQDSRARSLVVQYLARFLNPLVLVLLTASAVSAVTGEITNFIIISAIILLSVTLDFVQEHRASQAAQKLRQSVAVQAQVQRDGRPVQVAVRELVPGDVVTLAAGDLVPADGIVLQATDFFVKQALLTGEAFPVEKHAGPPAKPPEGLDDATHAVFMGTVVISGTARVLVTHTGKTTQLGGIAASVIREPPPSAFELGARRFGMLILRMTVLLVLFVLLVNAWQHRPWLESFLFAVALAVGLTPELLPMVVSVTLSRGAMRMAKQQVIVKRLTAIQDLGSMDVLCTDKTGTLTEAKIALAQHLDASGIASERVLELAYLNSWFETGVRSPLDDAILAHGPIDVQAWCKIDEVPFDFERRRVSVLLERAGSRLLAVKGAADEIIGLTVACEDALGHRTPLDDVGRQLLRDRCHALEDQGLRVLGIAFREVAGSHPHAKVGADTDLIFAGFAAFLDPPKASAAAALASLARTGVTVKVVTGDSARVTQHVCAELGVPILGVLTGAEMEQLDDYALACRAEVVNLFCRVGPVQKERIIRALKSRGHVVGYLGDGINDAPPLHAADVGISVDTAVDVAREAADMILLGHSLSVLHAGVLEGRRTFANIRKYMLMGTSSNFGNMFSMAGAALFLPFLPMLPTQILLNNMLYDISEVPIPLDRVDAADLRRPRVLDVAFIRNFMLVIGPISSLFDFLTFWLLLHVLHADQALFQTGWFIESLTTQVLVIFVIRSRAPLRQGGAHPLLVLTSLSVVAIGALLPLTPLGPYFGFVAPPLHYYALLAGLVTVYLFLVDAVKVRFYKYLAHHPPRQHPHHTWGVQ